MRVETETASFTLPPQRALFVPADLMHQVSMPGPVAMRALFIHPDAAADIPLGAIVVGPLLRALILRLAESVDRAMIGAQQVLISRDVPEAARVIADAIGIERLRANGIEVIVGILEAEGKELIKHFLHYNQFQQPYITLKYAQTSDGFIGIKQRRVQISNELSNRYVHHLRAAHQGILVGKNTIITDNPSLDVRYWNGKNPVRIVLGNDKNIPSHYSILNKKAETVFLAADTKKLAIDEVLQQLHSHSIQSVLVEGGASVLQQFIKGNFWNEAHIITSNQPLHSILEGIPQNALKAPELVGQTTSVLNVENNTIQIIKNTHAVSFT